MKYHLVVRTLPSLFKLWFFGQKGLALEVTELIYGSLTHPRGDMGWSAVCECEFSRHTDFFTLTDIMKT